LLVRVTDAVDEQEVQLAALHAPHELADVLRAELIEVAALARDVLVADAVPGIPPVERQLHAVLVEGVILDDLVARLGARRAQARTPLGLAQPDRRSTQLHRDAPSPARRAHAWQVSIHGTSESSRYGRPSPQLRQRP